MAKRPVFVVGDQAPRAVEIRMVEFEWFAGFSDTQKQKSIASLHATVDREGLGPALEVSRRAPVETGWQLSAFNLHFQSRVTGQKVSVEAAFQGGKVFRDGGPYVDLLQAAPREAKKDVRLRESGPLTGFRYGLEEWGIVPQTAFYDWLYVNAVIQKKALVQRLSGYNAFTDIEFNPKKSKNCQAHSLALAIWAIRSDLIGSAPLDKASFLSLLQPYYNSAEYGIVTGWGNA